MASNQNTFPLKFSDLANLTSNTPNDFAAKIETATGKTSHFVFRVTYKGAPLCFVLDGDDSAEGSWTTRGPPECPKNFDKNGREWLKMNVGLPLNKIEAIDTTMQEFFQFISKKCAQAVVDEFPYRFVDEKKGRNDDLVARFIDSFHTVLANPFWGQKVKLCSLMVSGDKVDDFDKLRVDDCGLVKMFEGVMMLTKINVTTNKDGVMCGYTNFNLCSYTPQKYVAFDDQEQFKPEIDCPASLFAHMSGAAPNFVAAGDNKSSAESYGPKKPLRKRHRKQ